MGMVLLFQTSKITFFVYYTPPPGQWAMDSSNNSQCPPLKSSDCDLPYSSSRLALCQMVLDQNLIRHFPGLCKDLGGEALVLLSSTHSEKEHCMWLKIK